MKLKDVLKMLNLGRDDAKDSTIYLEFADDKIDGIWGTDVAIDNKWTSKINVLKINLNQNYSYDLLCDLSGFIKNNRTAVNKAVKEIYTPEHLKDYVHFCDGSRVKALAWYTDDATYPDKDGEKFCTLIGDIVMGMLEIKGGKK